jgi:hypothetical protein
MGVNIHLHNPKGLGERLVGKRISHYENFSRNSLTIYLEGGEAVTVADPLGIHVGYIGYFDSPVESVEHVGHGTFVRSLDGSDLLRFVTVGWSA